MVLPNFAFDALMFGLLLLAAGLDSVFPVTHGVLSLLVVGGATYWAAQELSDALLRRTGWTQESLATSVALCVGGFLYYALRNNSDLALLALSIGLMMSALMVSISILAALGTAFKEGKILPLAGWLATVIAAVALGAAAGVLALALGVSPGLLPIKVGGIIGALALWKLREKLAPPSINPHFQQENAAQGIQAQGISAPEAPAPAAPATPFSSSTQETPRALVPAAPLTPPLTTQRVAIFPQRGTLFDRLFPLLVLGFLLAVLTNNSARLSLPGTSAVASQSGAANGGLNGGPVAPSDNGEAR